MMMKRWLATLLVVYLSGVIAAQDGTGTILVPYIYGDGGIVVLQAGAEITITWQNPPPDAVLYLVIWDSYHDNRRYLMGYDLDPADGVAFQWNVPERIGGEVYGVAWFADGTSIIHPSTGIEYASGKAPPEGICTAEYGSLGGSPEVFDNIPNLGPYQALGYLRDYAPVLERFVDDVNFPWYKVDLSDESVINPHDTAPDDLPDVGWIYAHNVRLHGDCSFLEDDTQ